MIDIGQLVLRAARLDVPAGFEIRGSCLKACKGTQLGGLSCLGPLGQQEKIDLIVVATHHGIEEHIVTALELVHWRQLPISSTLRKTSRIVQILLPHTNRL